VTEIEPVPPDALPVPARPRDQSPYWVYLARFSGESERTMRRCLDRVAALILHQPPAVAAPRLGEAIPWEGIRYPHVVLLRTEFTEAWESLSHVNKHMSALRGVLRECWRLGLMSAEDYQRARDVENVRAAASRPGAASTPRRSPRSSVPACPTRTSRSPSATPLSSPSSSQRASAGLRPPRRSSSGTTTASGRSGSSARETSSAPPTFTRPPCRTLTAGSSPSARAAARSSGTSTAGGTSAAHRSVRVRSATS
jgi:hypothetical protein